MHAIITFAILLGGLQAADDPAAAKLYQEKCAVCHDSTADSRTPTRAALGKMRPATILRALQTGVMKEQGRAINRTDAYALANYLGTVEVSTASSREIANLCAGKPWNPPPVSTGWAGWGNGLANWRYQADGGISETDLPRLKLKWAFAFPDATSMRSQPAVFGGRVFIAGQDGSVYALDAATGCAYWKSTVVAQVRSGMAIGERAGGPVVIFGDGAGYVYALDAATGREVWKLRPDGHPASIITATPVYHKDRVYVGVSSYEEGSAQAATYVCCTFRGSVAALNVADGRVVWQTHTIAEPATNTKKTRGGKDQKGPSGAGIWSPPTLDAKNGMLYVTTGDNYSDPPTATSDAVLAMDLASGAVRWSKQLTAGDAYNMSCGLPGKANCPESEGPDYDFGASAMLVDLAKSRRALILGQKSGMVHAIDPDRKGELLWSSRAGEGGTLGGIQWGIATDGSRAYAAVSDIRFTRTPIPGQNAVKREPNPEKGGGLLAFRVDNGERVWHTPNPGCGDRRPCSPAQSAAVSAMPGVVLSGSVDGHMRAYSTKDGRILWDFDTVRDFTAVNGVPGRGGAMDAGGPVVAGGMLFFASGYGNWGALPGNVLLAFSIDGK